MPRTRSLAWAELKIGAITIFAVVMTLLLIFLLSGESGFSWQRYGIKAKFDNIAGLKPGAPVRVSGMEVGFVTDTTFAGDRVEVAMWTAFRTLEESVALQRRLAERAHAGGMTALARAHEARARDAAARAATIQQALTADHSSTVAHRTRPRTPRARAARRTSS